MSSLSKSHPNELNNKSRKLANSFGASNEQPGSSSSTSSSKPNAFKYNHPFGSARIGNLKNQRASLISLKAAVYETQGTKKSTKDIYERFKKRNQGKKHTLIENFPKERERLFKLIESSKAKNPVLISGDRHIAEISRLKDSRFPNGLYEITSSGMTHVWKTYKEEKANSR